MPRLIRRIRVAEENGQTMAEYGVVLALITLAVLAAFTLLGDNISSALESVAGLLP
jgi:pilus assembly protein Flp/PilA